MYNKSKRSRKSLKARKARKSRKHRKPHKSSQKIKYLKGKGIMYMLTGTGDCYNKSYKDCLSCSKRKNRSCIFDYKKQSCRPNKR